MNIRDRIIKEIGVQKQIQGEDFNLYHEKIIIWFLNSIKNDLQFNLFVNTEFYSYGTMSYESHRFYNPREELLKLYESAVQSNE